MSQLCCPLEPGILYFRRARRAVHPHSKGSPSQNQQNACPETAIPQCAVPSQELHRSAGNKPDQTHQYEQGWEQATLGQRGFRLLELLKLSASYHNFIRGFPRRPATSACGNFSTRFLHPESARWNHLPGIGLGAGPTVVRVGGRAGARYLKARLQKASTQTMKSV